MRIAPQLAVELALRVGQRAAARLLVRGLGGGTRPTLFRAGRHVADRHRLDLRGEPLIALVGLRFHAVRQALAGVQRGVPCRASPPALPRRSRGEGVRLLLARIVAPLGRDRRCPVASSSTRPLASNSRAVGQGGQGRNAGSTSRNSRDTTARLVPNSHPTTSCGTRSRREVSAAATRTA